MRSRLAKPVLCFLSVVLLLVASPVAAQVIPPDRFMGHPIAADFTLDRWDKIVAYLKHVDEASDRVTITVKGKGQMVTRLLLRRKVVTGSPSQTGSSANLQQPAD